MVAFVFGALPQFVKIFAMRGVVATQSVAAAYMGAFVVSEMLRVTAGVADQADLDPSPSVELAKSRLVKIQAFVVRVMLAVQVGLWAWIVSETLPSSWFHSTYSGKDVNDAVADTKIPIELSPFAQAIATIHVQFIEIFFLVLPFLLFVWLVAHIMDSIPHSYRRLYWHWAPKIGAIIGLSVDSMQSVAIISTLIGFTLIVWLPGTCLIMWGWDELMRRFPAFFSSAVRLEVGICCILLFRRVSFVIYRGIFVRSLPQHAILIFGVGGSESEFVWNMFLISNLLCVTLYYSIVFSSDGTFSPDWSTAFG